MFLTSRLHTAFVVFTGTMFIAASALVSSGGAPAARTGAPGEQTCVDGCHSSNPLNSGPGSVVIETPAEYSPAEVIDVVVRVSDPSANSFGFEITAKDGNNNHVGVWDFSGQDVRSADASQNYVTHTDAKSSTASFEWTIPWTAPTPDAGPVTFYAAGNGADGGGSPFNDQIYSTSGTILPRNPTFSENQIIPSDIHLDRVFPNPFRDRATITYTLDRPLPVQLELYDLTGRRLKSEELGLIPAGLNEWVITNSGFSAGVIIYRLSAGNQAKSGMVILAR